MAVREGIAWKCVITKQISELFDSFEIFKKELEISQLKCLWRAKIKMNKNLKFFQ